MSRRYVAWLFLCLLGWVERGYARKVAVPGKVSFEGSPDFEELMRAALSVLQDRWAYGGELVNRYVELVIQFNMADRKGFVSGVWMYGPDLGRVEVEEVAIRLVRMAVLRRAYLRVGWRSFVWNERFSFVGQGFMRRGRERLRGAEGRGKR